VQVLKPSNLAYSAGRVRVESVVRWTARRWSWQPEEVRACYERQAEAAGRRHGEAVARWEEEHGATSRAREMEELRVKLRENEGSPEPRLR
jgi:hypothetical protein